MNAKHADKRKIQQALEAFEKVNKEEGLRVFVAGGARAGKDEQYVEEAYKLGRLIVDMDLKLDFGLSNSGMMGAAAKGVIDGYRENGKENVGVSISGITTEEYFNLYDTSDEIISNIGNVIFTSTLEERKNKLLMADFIVFTPGGVGTLDELAYDCVAMQDGLIDKKPFILYNINGFFHHLVEFLKYISQQEFADPIPFIIVDDSRELEIVFRLLKLRYSKADSSKEVYENARKLIYELPYFLKQKTDSSIHVEDIDAKVRNVLEMGCVEEKQELANQIEQAYLEKEIERMYERLAKTGRDTSVVSDKLTSLKKRKVLGCGIKGQ